MNNYKNKPRILSFGNTLSFSCVVLALLLSFPAVSAIDETAIHQATVRVEANGHFASGFLYGGDDHVVTSLHAVLPPTQKIEIYCKGSALKAKVVKYSKEADLVLLKAQSSLQDLGCNPYPDLKINPAKPPVGTNLMAWGFRGDNRRTALPHMINKGSAETETLAGLVADTAVEKVRVPNMIPNADLPLYQIAGGLFPGLSGGPVFHRESAELVGIVEGGLDKGVTNHAWLVPIGNLQKLLNSEDNDVLPNIDPSDYGYSSPTTSQTAGNVIKYINPDSSYSWVKTKSRSFQQLRDSADESLGLEDLVDDLFPDIENPEDIEAVEAALYALRFDIYEESEHGLIIAVPEGSRLKVEEEEEEEGEVEEGKKYHYLVVENEKNTADFEVDYGSKKILAVTDSDGNVVGPAEERYFAEALDEWMFNACQDLPSPCFYDEEDAPAVVVDFGQNRKMIRFSYHTETYENDELKEVDYFSISMLVKGDKIMQVNSLTKLNHDSAAMQCLSLPTAKACGKPYWDQVAFLLAARLSSFTNLGETISQTGPIVLDYKCKYCEPLSASFFYN